VHPATGPTKSTGKSDLLHSDVNNRPVPPSEKTLSSPRSSREKSWFLLGVKTGGYGRILVHPVSYPNVFKTDSGSDTDS
jgi:hypothetical protein